MNNPNRRKLLSRAGSATVAAWSTPVVTSVVLPAHATSTQTPNDDPPNDDPPNDDPPPGCTQELRLPGFTQSCDDAFRGITLWIDESGECPVIRSELVVLPGGNELYLFAFTVSLNPTLLRFDWLPQPFSDEQLAMCVTNPPQATGGGQIVNGVPITGSGGGTYTASFRVLRDATSVLILDVEFVPTV